MTTNHLQEWIEHPEVLNQGTLYELRNLMARYPYFQSLRLLYLKNLYLLHDASFGPELRKSVLYVANRSVLFQFIEGINYHLAPLQKEENIAEDDDDNPAVDKTLKLIDAFLATVPEEAQPAPSVGFDYSVDYMAYAMQNEESLSEQDQTEDVPPMKGQGLIDDFIQQSESADGTFVPTYEEDPTNQEDESSSSVPVTEGFDDGCFTETLAKIYIKQQRYEKALEIIKRLSLNYPKKNAYFADQIRFLEKLIINAKSK